MKAPMVNSQKITKFIGRLNRVECDVPGNNGPQIELHFCDVEVIESKGEVLLPDGCFIAQVRQIDLICALYHKMVVEAEAFTTDQLLDGNPSSAFIGKLMRWEQSFSKGPTTMDPDGSFEPVEVIPERQLTSKIDYPSAAKASLTRPFVEDVKTKFAKWQCISDPDALEIVFATAVAIYLPGDPLWSLLVGPPGGGKTEMLSMFADAEDAMMLSKLTPHTLLTGLTKVKDGTDLLYQLNEKLLVIKDLAPILELGKNDQQEILSDLRDAYDGRVVRAWGSGKKTAKWEGHFGLLAAATPAIDRHWNFFAELGERYIRINLRTRREEQTRMALQQMGTEDAMREELREAGAQLLTHYKNTTLEPPRLSKSFRDRVLDIAEVTAVLRTHVIRDNNHDIPIMPEPEVGTRLGKQMLKLAQAVAFLYEKTEPGDFEHSLLLRAAIDALQPRRLRVLKALIEGASTLNEVNKSTSVPRQTLKYELENLALLRAVTEVGDGKEWILNENVGSKLKQTGLAEIITRDLPPKDS